MIKKITNFYIKLYISEDIEHGKPRGEVKRLWFLFCSIIFTALCLIGVLGGLLNVIGNLLF